MSTVRIRPHTVEDEAWVEALLQAELGGRLQARRGELVDVLAFEGFIAEADGARVGYLSYRLDATECEIAALATTERHGGVGTALVRALRERIQSCQRVWVVTTNDNVEALRFYQRRGFRLSALRVGAVDDSRTRLKPSIPATGDFGIPLRDELELEARVEDLPL